MTPDYDAADDALQQAAHDLNRELERDLVGVIGKAMPHLTDDETALLCYGCGVDRRLLKPQRRAA